MPFLVNFTTGWIEVSRRVSKGRVSDGAGRVKIARSISGVIVTGALDTE